MAMPVAYIMDLERLMNQNRAPAKRPALHRPASSSKRQRRGQEPLDIHNSESEIEPEPAVLDQLRLSLG